MMANVGFGKMSIHTNTNLRCSNGVAALTVVAATRVAARSRVAATMILSLDLDFLVEQFPVQDHVLLRRLLRLRPLLHVVLEI
jgi:hypothetical protein